MMNCLLGQERAPRAYPHRSLLDAGVHLSFGSDMPGEATFDPLLGIHYTVNRSDTEVEMTIVGGRIVYQKGGTWPFTNTAR